MGQTRSLVLSCYTSKLRNIICALLGESDEEVPVKQRLLHFPADTGGTGRKAQQGGMCPCVNHSREELDAALVFFDIFLCKKDALPEVVFTHAQVPLDELSKLVEKQYSLKAAQETPSKAADVATTGCNIAFRDRAILNLKFLQQEVFNKHYKDGIFTEEEFITLLEELLIISKISPMATDYLFPAIMTRESEIMSSLESSSVAPLVVKFSTGWAPPGVHCCSVCHLLSQAKWEVKAPTTSSSQSEAQVTHISKKFHHITKCGRHGSVTFINNFSFYKELSCSNSVRL
jgi:hypothetical protein